jgi:DNA-binding response OmpR family regulator
MAGIMRPESSSARKTTVLLAEDESAIAMLFEFDLTRRGYCVLKALSGQEALKLSAEFQAPIDVLVTDWHMPGLSGDDLARRLLHTRPDLKIILMSGHPDAAAKIDGFANGQALFVSKPVSPIHLVECIDQLLDVPDSPDKRAA